MTTNEIQNLNIINIKSFIKYIITFDNIDDILDNFKTQSEKGFIFERLWDIIIKFGFCDIFTNYNFNHLIGNSNNGKLKILKNFDKYLEEKVISGNSSGCSLSKKSLDFLDKVVGEKVKTFSRVDITLQNKEDDT